MYHGINGHVWLARHSRFSKAILVPRSQIAQQLFQSQARGLVITSAVSPWLRIGCAVKLQLVAVCNWLKSGSDHLRGRRLVLAGAGLARRWRLPQSGKVGPIAEFRAAMGPTEWNAPVQSTGAHLNCFRLWLPDCIPARQAPPEDMDSLSLSAMRKY